MLTQPLLPRAAHPDELVVDDVRRHPHEREVPPSLADELVACGMRDEVREVIDTAPAVRAVRRRHMRTPFDEHTISRMRVIANLKCQPRKRAQRPIEMIDQLVSVHLKPGPTNLRVGMHDLTASRPKASPKTT